ncbi:MAG TPA: IclR family transcriptional regulator, partial [Bordetella sp.]|nr:IclR family transcriptional regulator [Bordetella sp.]
SGPQSVHRILDIFHALATRDKGMTLTAIAQELGAPKTSLVGLLNGLVERGHLDREEGTYHIGQEMFVLATQIVANMQLPALVAPSLRRLMEATGETALAGQMARDDQTLIYFAKEESTHPVRYTAPVGKREELYSTAMGKLLLAHMEPGKQKHYLGSKTLRAYTPRTILKKADLLRQLQAIQETGISQSVDERVVGSSGIAVAVTGKDGSLLFGLGLAGPTERMLAARDSHRATLEHEAAAIKRLTGNVPRKMLSSIF